MKYLFFLSGENVELAKWEVLRTLARYGAIGKVDSDSRLLTVDFYGKCPFSRLGMTHEVVKLLQVCEYEQLENVFYEVEIPSAKLCVRVKNLHTSTKISSTDLEKRLGAVLWRRGADISVSNPRYIYRIYITEKRCYVGILIHSQDKKQFIHRDPIKRPFFMPSVILPKLARTLVNLSGVRERERMVDPMCGTGSILIEAEIMNISSIGMDIYHRIVEGCRKNLLFYGLDGEVIRGDARSLPFRDESVDAIVTDYPYLRSTKSVCDLEELYEKSIEEFFRVLKSGGGMVLVTNTDIEHHLGKFFMIAKFLQRVHGSLTRRIYLCEKVN
jgi:tRNA (guanine10-N2)-dimethyltransferase